MSSTARTRIIQKVVCGAMLVVVLAAPLVWYGVA
jgi:hypothetical protein